MAPGCFRPGFAGRRIASGGFENLGLKIVDGLIYTVGRDEITRYHDLNGDGETDYYENFCNLHTSSQGFHEFVFDDDTIQTDHHQGDIYPIVDPRDYDFEDSIRHHNPSSCLPADARM